jgi:hypothetical protein
LVVAALVGACASPPAAPQKAQTAPVGVQLRPSPAVIAKGKDPAPPANVQTKASAGKDRLALGTANTPSDTDSFWVESLDLDSDGTVESVDLLWDDEDKILLFYGQEDFVCKNGTPGSGALLIAVNGQGNPRNRPAGSGFWAVSLDQGQCDVQTAALWGCRFDANGNPTTCGIVALDEKTDELLIAIESR